MQLPGIDPHSPELSASLRDALTARGPRYRPRTRHKGTDGQPLFINRLILATSPYLLQHAHNPVAWWPWEPEAFQEARRRDVPVLLSAGYSTCHWCHVMEEESFEDLTIAALLNSRFIPIKLDREERPDIDGIYMAAVQLLSGHGGWPMTVALTPDGEAFFGGTYFPPFDGARGARMGLHTVLTRLADGYAQDRPRVLRAARELSEAVREAARPQPGREVPGEATVLEAARALARRFDAEEGGFSRAPKFPRPAVLTFLLRYARRAADAGALHMVTHTLEKMAAGGLHDQLAGGFHRYSTDDLWRVPHFEKMLYDNAQLAVSYLEAWQCTGRAPLAEVVRSTLAYVEREMTSPEGAFWSATDADSDGEEGRYFTWTEAELDANLDPADAAFAKSYYGVRREGHFEGRSVLHRPLGLAPPPDLAQHARVTARLREVRAARNPPLLDDKIILEWNAQMVSAFARAGRAFGDDHLTLIAARAMRWLLATLRAPDGRLLRTYQSGRAQHPAVLEDYAFTIASLLDLLECTGDAAWIEQAVALQADLDRDYFDREAGGYFTAAAHVPGLLVREKPAHDGAQPSGSSVAVENLLRLAELTGNADYRATAEGTLRALSGALDRGALGAPLLAAALDRLYDDPPTIVVVSPQGPPPSADTTLLRALSRRYLGPAVVLPVIEGPAQERLARTVPLVAHKTARDGRPTAYVCTQGACRAPVTEPDALEAELTLKPYSAR